MEEKYYTQYIPASAENKFQAHYRIYKRGTAELANKKQYRRFANALKAKNKLENAPAPRPVDGVAALSAD